MTSRKRTLIIIGLFLGFMLLAAVAFSDHAGATTLAGNRGGCEHGYWFSRVATARTFRIGQIVTARGCEGLHHELYAPIRISR
jgi:hypothetical protein